MNGKVYKIFQVFSCLSIPHTSGPLYTARRSGKERKRRLGDRDYSSIASCDAFRGTARGSCEATRWAFYVAANRRLGRFIRLSFSLSMATQSQPVMSADETMSLPCFISPRASPWANPRNHISCQHTRSCCSIFCSIYFMNCIISQLHTVTVEPHSTTRLIYLSFCWVIYNHFWFFVSFKVLHGKFSSRRATTTKKSFFFFLMKFIARFPSHERKITWF